MIKAVLPNGVELNFPDGTDGDVIQTTVRKFYESDAPAEKEIFLDRLVDFTPAIKSGHELVLKAIGEMSKVEQPDVNVQVEVPVPEVKVEQPNITVDVPTPEVKVDVEAVDLNAMVGAINEGFTALADALTKMGGVQAQSNADLAAAIARLAAPRKVVRGADGLIKEVK